MDQDQPKTDYDKVISKLAREVENLKSKVNELETKEVATELGITPEDITKEGIVPPPPSRMGRGHFGHRPLLQSEIEEAQTKFECASACARYLGVSYKTYKKYSKRYGIHKTNPWGTGSNARLWDPEKGKYPLNQILNGEFPDYPIWRLKQLLFRSGKKEQRCEHPECAVPGGFKTKRPIDGKMPLIINFVDGNPTNHRLENLKIYCYNCTHLYGKGYLRRGIIKFEDADRLQGARESLV